MDLPVNNIVPVLFLSVSTVCQFRFSKSRFACSRQTDVFKGNARNKQPSRCLKRQAATAFREQTWQFEQTRVPPLHVNSLIRRQSCSRWNTGKAVTAENSVGSNGNIYVTTLPLVSSTLATFTRIKEHRVFFIGRIDGTSADHDFRARVRREENTTGEA